MLVAAIKQHVDTVANAITPKGGRAPFTRKMSAREAFDWWLKHRYDAIGMAEYNKFTPLQQQQLDAWLSGAVTATAGGQKPVPAPMPTPSEVLGPAIASERRVQGPAVGESAAAAPFYG
jgi:hypothetical protein